MPQCSYSFICMVWSFETYGCCPRCWLDFVIGCVASCWLAVALCNLCFVLHFFPCRPASLFSFRLFFPSVFYYAVFLSIFSFLYILLHLVWCTGLRFLVFCPRAHCGWLCMNKPPCSICYMQFVSRSRSRSF